MDGIRVWLTSVICAALIAGLAQSLTPQGLPRKMAQLSGGLLLLLALLSPIRGLKKLDIEGILEVSLEKIGDYAEAASENSGEQIKSIIEAETAAYISDKAAALGILSPAVTVTVRITDEGYPVPERVTVRGEGSEAAWAALRLAMVEDFGLKGDALELERTDGT